jgi:heme-degrading monooxygenase HmoA
MFKTRKGAIDLMPGFKNMNVLKPNAEDDSYLIVSYWDTEEQFKTWTKSEAFLEGHKRGFQDLKEAAERGEEAPMKSSFKTYEVIAN